MSGSKIQPVWVYKWKKLLMREVAREVHNLGFDGDEFEVVETLGAEDTPSVIVRDDYVLFRPFPYVPVMVKIYGIPKEILRKLSVWFLMISEEDYEEVFG